MFDLEKAIAEWRRRMLAAGITAPSPLNELESHLREDIDTLLSSGASPPEAFQSAVARLGTPGSMRAEFTKVEHTPWLPLRIAAWLWLGGSLAAGLFLLRGPIPERLSLLLLAHILSLTAGYGAAFLAGGFGIYYVCCRWLGRLSPARQQALDRSVFLFGRLAAGLVVAGLVLGMLWSGQHRGRYLGGDPREIGALGASVWLVVLWAVQRFGQVSSRTTMLLSIAGSLIASLAWFGAGIMAHGHGLGSWWPLNALLAVHLFFLGIGVLPAPEAAEA